MCEGPVSQRKRFNRRIGLTLILLGIFVGVVWLVTKEQKLEPLAFILTTAGALLLY